MKTKWKLFAFIICTPFVSQSWAQTNTFPSSGNVGIGNTSPSQALYVSGNSIIGSTSVDATLNGEGYFQSASALAGTGYLATPWVYARAIEGDQRGSGSTLITIGSQNGFTNNDEIGFITSGNMRLKIASNGNLGIGTSNPSEKLTVNGSARIEEVIVSENVGADFVFDDDYLLPVLSEVESFIKEHGHLSGIPSAEDMKREGVKVGELQIKLLQKIEELTLFLISHEDRIQKLESENKELKILLGIVNEK